MKDHPEYNEYATCYRCGFKKYCKLGAVISSVTKLATTSTSGARRWRSYATKNGLFIISQKFQRNLDSTISGKDAGWSLPRNSKGVLDDKFILRG